MTGRLWVRVLVADTWDAIEIAASPAAMVRDIKCEALRRAGVKGPPDGYLVKFRGAELWEDGRTLGDAGVVDNAGLIVLARRRRPVR